MFNIQNKEKTISYIIFSTFILLLFIFHLMPTLIAGLVVFLLINFIHNKIGEKVQSKHAHNLTLLIISVLVVSILSLLGLGIYSSLKFGSGNMSNVSGDMMNVLNQIKTYLPQNLVKYIPDDMFQLQSKVIDFSKAHMSDMLSMTSSSLKGFAHIIVGMFLGAVVAFSFLRSTSQEKDQSLNFAEYPYMNELFTRIKIFSNVFTKVGGAQIKISAINSVLTAIYLLIVLPLMGYHIPYAKTLVLATFLLGIIPVLGNLLSNTLIVVLSLMVSFEIAIASLVFLIVVHKLEYYINAKIVGSQIKTSIWELLIVMILMQSIFGVIGVVLAPVLYGYLKEELKQNNIIPS